LVIIKAENALSLMKNVLIPYIKIYESIYGNLNSFKVVNTMWVLENTMRRKLKISKVVKIAIRCFLKHRLPFEYNPKTRMPRRINVKKMKCVDQRLGLGFKLSKKDHWRFAERKKEKRLACIENVIEIPPIHMNFPQPTYMICLEKEFGQVIY
jgi:hypothetical protein